MSDVVGFTEPVAKQIYDKMRAVSDVPTPVAKLDFEQPSICIVRSTSGCSAGSSTSPGYGRGIVQFINASGNYEDFKTHSNSTIELDIYNTVTTALPGGANVRFQCKREAFSGKWFVDVANCE